MTLKSINHKISNNKAAAKIFPALFTFYALWKIYRNKYSKSTLKTPWINGKANSFLCNISTSKQLPLDTASHKYSLISNLVAIQPNIPKKLTKNQRNSRKLYKEIRKLLINYENQQLLKRSRSNRLKTHSKSTKKFTFLGDFKICSKSQRVQNV